MWIIEKENIYIYIHEWRFINPAENKPQFVQGEEKNIESSLKRMHLLNKSTLVNYTVLVEKDLSRAIGANNTNNFDQLSLLTKHIFLNCFVNNSYAN